MGTNARTHCPEYVKPALAVLALSLLLTLAACSAQPTAPPAGPQAKGEPITFTLQSPAFGEGDTIPRRYTCEGEDVSPELRWQDAPANAQSFALIMDDPDAPSRTFTHWVLFDIPSDRTSLSEGLPAGDIGTAGQNGFGTAGYGGPCPPPGHGPHRYFFTLYALDTDTLNLSSGTSRAEVEQALKGHVIGQAQLMGRYERK
ncbi:MAG: YbhB/YbcL family Raf kinase inhibitor-like protein [Anaerolineae bacterium]